MNLNKIEQLKNKYKNDILILYYYYGTENKKY